MSFVAIDVGASSTRYVSDSGRINVLPNNMIFLPDGQRSVIEPDKAQIENSLEFTIKKTAGAECEYFPVTALAGIMADRADGICTTPSVNAHKYNQKVNYISIVLAVAVSKLKYELEGDLDVYIAVPPIEIGGAREKFGATVPGTYEVTFPKFEGGRTVNVNIRNLFCDEESKMAVFSFFFDMNGVPNKEHLQFMSGRVLSIDIGASTSDLAIVDGGVYKDSSGQSYKTGGNVVRDRVMDAIAQEYAIDLSEADADRTITEGRLQMGNSYVPVGELVDNAKKSLADAIVKHMDTYFKKHQTSMQMMNAIIVSGGGSLQSQYIDNGDVVKTSEPMAYFVTERLSEQSPNTVVVNYGEDARFANVKGLYILAKLKSRATDAAGTYAK